MSTTTALTDRLRDTFSTAKLQLVTLEKEVEGRVQHLERRALDVPHQLRGVWDTVLVRLRSALSIATRSELADLVSRVEELTAKVEKLSQHALPAPALELVQQVADAVETAVETETTETATDAPVANGHKPQRKPPAKSRRR